MKVALITGGSRGLGQNAALKLAQRGVDIIITYQSRKEAALETVKIIQNMGRRAHALQLDTTKTSTFDSFTDEMRKVLKSWDRSDFDYLNNAGTGLSKPFSETTEEQFDELMSVHFKGPFFLTQKLLPILKDGGRILNVSSGLARMTLPGSSAYASMKGAMEVLTRYLAKELGPRKIAVNIIAPGAIETDFNGGAVRDNKNMNHTIASYTAFGRVGLPDDIGDAMANILDGDFGWMTAQRIEVSGGQSL